jgi:hypothetical protein
MNRRRVTSLLLFEVLSIAALHGLGTSRGFNVQLRDLPAPTTRVEDAVASGLRYLALVLGYWMLISTLLYLAARIGEFSTALRAIRWITLPPIRRAVDRGLAVGITISSLLTSLQAVAQTPPPPVEQTYAPAPTGSGTTSEPVIVVEDETYIPPGVFIPPPSDVGRVAVPEVDPVPSLPTHLLFAQPGPETYEVAVGDNLWSIAFAHLSETTGGRPSEGEVAAYWVELIAANLTSLTSSDPDLIYPGEEVVLPPIIS